MKATNSSIGRATRFLTLEMEKTLKDNKSESGATTSLRLKDGESYILTKLRDHKRKDLTKTLVSM
jgi:hypothetical protein